MFGFGKKKEPPANPLLAMYESVIVMMEKDVARGKDYSVEEIIAFVDKLAPLVNIPGGEPLVQRLNKITQKKGVTLTRR